MSSVTTDTTVTDTTGSGGDSDSTSLIDFTVYYDENGNLVTADGYLLDADGNLVVSADSELTGAYSVVGADGETYYVGEDASIVNGAILSSVDSSQDPIIVDAYGNVVNADGYILDQSDSDGNTILTIDSDSFTITARTTAEATDSDGNTVTLVDGSGYTFVSADTEAGTVYAIAKDSDVVYYDSYGNQVTSEGYLSESDGSTILSVSATQATAVTTYSQTIGSETYYYQVTATSSGSTSYYAFSDLSVDHLYLAGSQLTDDDYVYYDSAQSYYYLIDADSQTTVEFSATSASTDYDAGIYTVIVSQSSLDSVDNTDAVFIIYDGSSSSYYAYYGGYSTEELYGYTNSVEIEGDTYYFAAVTYYADTELSTLLSDLGSTTYFYSTSIFSSTNTTGVVASLQDYYTLGGTSESDSTQTLSLSLYVISASASSLYADSSGSTSVTVATVAGIYKGFQLLVDSNGVWVTATTSGSEVYYLADSDATDNLDVRLILDDSSLTTTWGYTIDGVTFLSSDTYDETATSVTNFVSSVDSDNTVYTATAGFTLDSDGYILDEGGEKQLLAAETLYTYTQSVEDTDSDGNGLGSYSTYYYYFGSEDGSEYYDSDAPLTVTVSSGNESIVYQVLTGVRGTIYYDANGNTVNAAGYLMDASTFDLIYTSATELTAGYSFTSIDGTTYIVSGQATIDTASGAYIVYSGVYETRYYGDSNENEYLDDYDTEYTSDELWIIIRNELGQITTYQSVEDGTEYTAEEWPGSSTTADTAVTV